MNQIMNFCQLDLRLVYNSTNHQKPLWRSVSGKYCTNGLETTGVQQSIVLQAGTHESVRPENRRVCLRILLCVLALLTFTYRERKTFGLFACELHRKLLGNCVGNHAGIF